MTNTNPTDYAAEIAALEAEHRSLSARIKAARRAAEQAETERREAAFRGLGKRLLDELTSHLVEASLDARVAAVERVLDDEEAIGLLVFRVGELSTHEQVEDARTDDPARESDDLEEVEGARFASQDHAPEGGAF